MTEKDYYAAVDRIQLIDERLAYEMIKLKYPNYKNSRSEYDFWKGYSKVVEKDKAAYYVPFSFLTKFTENIGNLKYNYALVRLVDYLTDIEQPVYLGLDFSKYQKFETDLILAAEYLSELWSIHSIERHYVMHIRYRKDFGNQKNVYVVRENENLIVNVENHIIDIAKFRYDLIVNKYPVTADLTNRLLSCIQNEFREFVLVTSIGEDDRCYMDNAFMIYVPEKNLSLPYKEWGYSPYEYFYAGEKSAFEPFNELMSFIYDSMNDYERELFPFK